MQTSQRRPDELPPVEQVVPGLWSIPVPIPGSPPEQPARHPDVRPDRLQGSHGLGDARAALPYVFAYAFEVPGGVVLVDPGWNAAEALAALEDGLGSFGARLVDVRGVLVTHLHPDHYGLAGRVREVSGAWIGLHPADAALIPDRYEDADDLLRRISGWLEQTGAPAADLAELRDATMQLRRFVVVARPDLPLADGDRPDLPGWRLRAVHTPGHTPGHLCFVEERTGVVLTGDHVLPTISPNIARHPQAGPDPLADYLASLERLRRWGDGLALPGHQWRFDGLTGRIDELIAHHERRLAEVEAAVADGAATIWEVATRTTWSRPWREVRGFMRRAALGETAAHLAHLEGRGRLERTATSPLRWRVRSRAPAVPRTPRGGS
jgi:glyoxylase-like metal-dependent hydrolase (beta-lactamase superfamily II)